jgi:ABC-2 type transport system ATP-binding protein
VSEPTAAAGGPSAASESSRPPDVTPIAPVVLATFDLTKRFGHVLAVDHLNLSVRRGDVFGFLGPNGAGKTTTIRMMVGLIFPTEGYAQIVDHRLPGDRLEALKHVGGFVEVPAFYRNMTGRDNLRMLGELSGDGSDARVNEALDLVGLRERADSKVGEYSHGMNQRLGIAQALLHEPEVVILDEPTNGLDPQGMKDVRDLVRELGARGKTVFLSSHLLHEVEQVCNRAVIINKGRVVVEGPVSELRPEHTAVKLLTRDQVRARDVLGALVGQTNVSADEEYLVVDGVDGNVPDLVEQLVHEGLKIEAVVPAREQGLEDYFLGLTQSSDVDTDRSALPLERKAS